MPLNGNRQQTLGAEYPVRFTFAQDASVMGRVESSSSIQLLSQSAPSFGGVRRASALSA
jgi:hypothetical protein